MTALPCDPILTNHHTKQSFSSQNPRIIGMDHLLKEPNLSAIEAKIEEALSETVVLLQQRFDSVNGIPEPGSALDQAGLLDGADIIREYMHNTEAGLALEHLIYMIYETNLSISSNIYSCVEAAGQSLRMDPKLWKKLEPSVLESENKFSSSQ